MTRSDPRKTSPSPLVLHGPPGTGKSLLVQTLVDRVSRTPSGISIRMIPAGELVREPNGGESLTGLRDADLLVLEDLQMLPVRSAPDLVQLLDHRSVRGRPTVITANTGPAGLIRYPRRLTNRLASGLTIRLNPLGPASRRVLLEYLATKRGLRLSEEARDWLAARSRGGARPLLGALARLGAEPRRSAAPMDLETVCERLANEPPPTGSVEQIVARVSSTFGVRPKDLLGTGRQRAVIIPRHVAMYLAREVAKLSLPRVGSAFGRDHSTVLHACRKVAAAVKDDVQLRQTVRELSAELA